MTDITEEELRKLREFFKGVAGVEAAPCSRKDVLLIIAVLWVLLWVIPTLIFWVSGGDTLVNVLIGQLGWVSRLRVW